MQFHLCLIPTPNGTGRLREKPRGFALFYITMDAYPPLAQWLQTPATVTAVQTPWPAVTPFGLAGIKPESPAMTELFKFPDVRPIQ